MRIALAQINVTIGDFEGNARKIADYIEQARARHADIVVFPELAVCGYPPEDLLLKEHFVDDNLRALKLIARETLGITAVVGFVDRGERKNLYNAAAVLHNGKIKGVYHKMDLPNYGVFDEKRYFTPGKTNSVFIFGKAAVGISICEDIWKKDGPQTGQAKKGAQVLINLSASPFHVGKSKIREEMLKARARENKTFVCYVNLLGGQDELVFDGGSYIFNPAGKLMTSGRPFEENLIIMDIDTKKTKKTAGKNVKAVLVTKNDFKAKPDVLSGKIAPRLGEIEEVYKALVIGTRDYIAKNSFKKAVVGLSGGIDSSLVAVIAADAIGRQNVVGVSMPSKFTSTGTRSDGKILAENLKIKFFEVPIEPVMETYLNVLKGPFADEKRDITEENLQARIRGNILMAFSNKFGWLVLTTGNKSEIATGYCTLYGDMAGGFAVVKDVPKTMIYKLARFRNQKEGKPVIPESVFKRAPTAELRENQKDEDSLPPYAVLDPIITDYVEADKSLKEMLKRHSVEAVKKAVRLIDQSEYKRRQTPPGVKITPRAFGRDRRLPITNRYKEHGF